MGVSSATIVNWETGRTEPPVNHWPAIVAFLGYNPAPPPTTIGERMLAYRRRDGLSIKEAAARAGVDEGSWAQWERTGMIVWRRYRDAMESFLANSTALPQ
jgi:DNA-binding XRE family transcriptional regulator